jgi:hypothetical protein
MSSNWVLEIRATPDLIMLSDSVTNLTDSIYKASLVRNVHRLRLPKAAGPLDLDPSS